jgi:hypothetical protein
LCGVPSLPACPMFWKNGRLSTEGKIAIGVSSLFVFCLILLVVYIYIRRRRNDYDFALPHELTGNYDSNRCLNRLRYTKQPLFVDISIYISVFCLVMLSRVMSDTYSRFIVTKLIACATFGLVWAK